MDRSWFKTWILAPLLVPPAIILDPFTFYWNELVDSCESDVTAESESEGRVDRPLAQGSR